jgi:hypothetical protein
MKSRALFAFLALFLLSLATPPPSSAQAGGAAFGTYRFQLDDELEKLVEFEARTDDRGITTGAMVFTDRAKVPDLVDEDETRPSEAFELYIKVDLDSMTIDKNRAVMNGIVRDSSHRSYIEQWVQLVVLDTGDNPRVPDQLTWKICRRRPGGWVPSDAELAFDDGAFRQWWATDAERRDDVGIPSVNLLGKDTGCQVFPFAVYAFADLLKSEGDIVVKP